MTRLLFYNHAAEISGAERSLLAIARHAGATGIEVLLCCPPGALMDAASDAGIRTAVVAPLTLGRARNPLVLTLYLLQALRPALDLRRAVRRFRPDILHANTVRAGLTAEIALRFVRQRPSLVVHVRDVLEAGVLDRLTAGALARGADTVIAISHYVAQPFRGSAAEVRVLHNAIDVDRYQRSPERGRMLRTQLGISPEAPLLLVAGQITPWKGQREALEAFALVRQHSTEAQLVIAGAVKFSGKHRRYDNDAYMHALCRRAGMDDLVGAVHMPGELEDIAGAYSAATLSLVPSWTEPFGRVVIEAMAAGCPVIGTAAGGIPEIITDGEDGILVPARDPAALATATLRLLGDPALRRALAEQAGHRVAERFSMDGYFGRLSAIWRERQP